MSVSNLIGQEVENGTPTKKEYEAAIYCEACFDELDALDRQKQNLKIQIESRGVIIQESKTVISDMGVLLERMKEQYYIAQKQAKKDKRQAYWRGLYTGAGMAGAAILIISISK